MTTLASLADVEAVAKAVPFADRARVERLLEMVSADVIGYTGQDFAQVTNDSVLLHPKDGELRLPQHPVTAIASVTVASVLIDPSQYEFSTNGYIKRLLPFNWVPDGQFWGPGEWNRYGLQWPVNGEFGWPPLPTTVVYTHGYADGLGPADLSLVVAEKVAEKWLAGARSAEGAVAESIDGYSIQFAGGGSRSTPEGGWSKEHKQILDRYRRSGFASVRLG